MVEKRRWLSSISEACSLPVSPLVHPDVQRRPERAELLLEESDARQGSDAVAAKRSLLLGAQGQVGFPARESRCSRHGERSLFVFPSFSARLIYFGGYSCKTVGEMQNTPATNFIIEELSWVTGGLGTTAAAASGPPSANASACLSGRDRKHAVPLLGLEQRGQRL